MNVDKALPKQWSDADWKTLFEYTSSRQTKAGQALIQRGEADRTLYFLVSGNLEVIVPSADGVGMGAVRHETAGTVLGEMSFFDGQKRSASVWSVDDCEVSAMDPDQYVAFEQAHPGLARDLLFALGRILTGRLRRATPRAAP